MNMKRAAASALATYLQAQIPALSGAVSSVAPDAMDEAEFPGLTIVPEKFRFMPEQESEQSDDPSVVGASNLLMRVGHLTGTMQLRLGTNFLCGADGRDEIEQGIIDAFVAREDSPGVVVRNIENLKVGSVQTVFTARAAFMLDQTEWREEMVFSNKRFSFIDVPTVVDVFAIRHPRYTINELTLAFTEDETSDTPVTEDVSVQDDGTISPAV